MSARYAGTTYESNDDTFIRLIGIIISIGAVISFAIVLFYFFTMDMYIAGPILYFVIVDAALIAAGLYLFLSGRANRNNILRFVSFAMVGLMLFINLFLWSYLDATKEIIAPTVTSSGAIEYSIVAQRTAGIQLSEKTEIRAGIQSTDAFKKEVERETSKLTAATFKEFNSISEIINATEIEKVEIAVVQSAMLNAFAEYFPESFDNLDILATFKAGTEKSQSAANDIKVDITKPFSIYVSGLDTDGDIHQTARSDSNMLILIDPEHYKMLLINTPRDYYVQLPGTRGYPDKLCHAGIYGIDMCEQTISELYGIDIDYHVQINFTTVSTFVESMGGIIVNNPRTFELWGQTYKEGEIWLNGDQALLFARARKGLEEGDLDRGKNQQLVIEGIVHRITSPDVVTHYKKLIRNLSGTFLSNVPSSVITQLFSRQIALGGSWTIEKMNAAGTPAQRPTYSMGSEDLSVIIPDYNSINEISMAINDFMRGK